MSPLAEAYAHHGKAVVHVAQTLSTLLYAARTRRELADDCLRHGDVQKAREHAKRRAEYAADLRNTIKRHGPVGQQAFRLAKQMEGPRS